MSFKYDKQPFVKVNNFDEGHNWEHYDSIVKELKKKIACVENSRKVLLIDIYPGVRIKEIRENIINSLSPVAAYFTDDLIFQESATITERVKDMMTEDRVFGKMCLNTFSDFIIPSKLKNLQRDIEKQEGLIIIYGVAASLVSRGDIYIYADLARWEIQQRYRLGEIPNWKHDNFTDDALVKFKRGYFFEWRMADRHKKANFKKFDYVLDTNIKDYPKMITGEAFLSGLEQTVHRPFRVVPFFDPGVWGGQWMKEVCDLDRNLENYAWCFDCVPEENSLLLKVGETIVEIPSIDAVFVYPVELLGDKVHARFGTEFPIRFDFLDTMDGQNLSLQVHPLVEYAQEKFGIHYTQDESYYILDAKEDTYVYLGVKTGTTKEKFFEDLRKAQEGLVTFPDEEHVNKIPAKKHDHFLIPAGTAHCSGADTMVLEISATPYIFTFKLWDWGRVGLDGKPRPIHIDHGEQVLQFDRNTEWTLKNLVNRVDIIEEGEGFKEERTGLHEREFIETRRHWFSSSVTHNTNGGVNVINLVEGEQAIVESPTKSFEPFIVNYAETFIIPASIGEYTITPYGDSIGKTIATIKAYVRN